MANRQMKALATVSQVAFQTLQYSCEGGMTAHRAIGWNGQEMSAKQTYSSLMLSIDVQDCEVILSTKG